MSTLTKMFDPTIYSLQPLVTTPVTIPLQTTTTTSATSNDTPLNIGDHDPSPSSEGHSGSSSLKDIVVVGDAEQQRAMDGNYEDLDTVSRKTSTTSDYTSLSDYTPENTVTRESSVTTSTLRNDFATDECIESSDALTTGESVRNDDSCVIEMSDKLVSGVEETISPLLNENLRSPDAEVPPPSQRARKISRFLVTPSVVSIDCDNERTVDEIQQMKSEGVYDGQLNTMQQQMYNEDGTVVSVQQIAQFEASQQQIPFSQPLGFGYSGDMIDANLMNNQTIEQYNAAMPNKPLGPESINTLEQLKIGLENITHAHVQPTKPKDAQPAVSEAIKSTGQLNEEQTSNSVESPMSYADVAAGSTVQIMNEITGQQFEPVSDGYLQQHQTVQQLQSPHTGIQMTSSPQANMASTSEQIPSSTSENLSQTTSVYNSRRTSAEFAAIEQCIKTTSDIVTTLDNVESAENSRKLSQQGSVDKPEM